MTRYSEYLYLTVVLGLLLFGWRHREGMDAYRFGILVVAALGAVVMYLVRRKQRLAAQAEEQSWLNHMREEAQLHD